jgi:hypothetical protein
MIARNDAFYDLPENQTSHQLSREAKRSVPSGAPCGRLLTCAVDHRWTRSASRRGSTSVGEFPGTVDFAKAADFNRSILLFCKKQRFAINIYLRAEYLLGVVLVFISNRGGLPMSVSRRGFLVGGASIAGAAAIAGKGFAQTGAPPAVTLVPTTIPAADLAPVAAPTAGAALELYNQVGAKEYTELHSRLVICNNNIKTRGLKKIRGVDGTFLTGYPYNEFYDWDLYFENLYLSYFGVYPYCFTNLKEFLNREQPDGYVNRSLIKQRDRQQFKPFLAQLLVLGAKQNGNDYEWVRGNYYDRLKKYIDKWFSYDGDKNGLPTWNSADAAGTDNQWSRAGQLGAFEVEGVDLASYLVRELRAMAVIGDHLGQKDDVKAFNDHADKVCKLINDVFWDEAEGIYYDRNEKKNAAVKVKSVTNFMPLFAGAATPERAKRMINEHLLNEKEFWLSYPVASYAKTEPDYYQGSHNECNWRGSTWAPTNYMIFQGLMHYGYPDVAKELASRLFEMAVVKNPMLREYYNAENGSGLGQTQFWGFTALYYGMIMEYHLKYDASDLTAPHQPMFTKELGITMTA